MTRRGRDDDARREHGESTRSVHGGETSGKYADAITEPIACTATYVFRDSEEIAAHFERRIEREEYGRYGNPTVRAAEKKIAALEGTEEAALFASGMGAVTTVLLAMLRAGQHVVMTNDCYRRTRQFVTGVLSRFGVEATLVEPDDYEGMAAAIRPGETRLIISESPTNPYLRVVDLERIAGIAAEHRGLKTMIDATFAPPTIQRPAEYGIDLVVHSCTKYFGGHNDLLAGAVCGKAGIVQALRDFRGVTGPVLDPHAAYLLIRGLKTLDLRVRRQSASALAIAQWLEGDPRIERVFYPGLQSHPEHEIARRQMRAFGGVVSFLVRGSLDDVSRFIDACEIPAIGPSLGGVESLIEQPALMSFYELTTAQREQIGIRDNLVRFAVGIEDAEDLISDLASALDEVFPPG